MNVELKPSLKKFVEKQIKAGRYETADDLFAAAVTRLMQEDGDFDFAPGELQAIVEKGESDIARGNVLTLNQIRKQFHQRRGKASPKAASNTK